MFQRLVLPFFVLILIAVAQNETRWEQTDDPTTIDASSTTIPFISTESGISTTIFGSGNDSTTTTLPTTIDSTVLQQSTTTPPPPVKVEKSTKEACLNGYDSFVSRFADYQSFAETSVISFCDYAFYRGNEAFANKTKDVTQEFRIKSASMPSYPFLECSRIMPNLPEAKDVRELSWKFLSYCIYNSPTNSSKPDCFKNIGENCANPSSSKCKLACYHENPEPDYPDDPHDSSSALQHVSSTGLLLISCLFILLF